MPILVGDVYPASYTAPGGTLTGATVALTVTRPDGSTATPATTVDPAAGTAASTIAAPLAGSYLLVWSVTGTVVDVEQDQFTAYTPVLELVSLADVREDLRIQPADRSMDGKLRRYIHAAADVIEHVCGPISGQARTDVFDGGGTFVVLPHQWVKGLTAVTEYRGHTGYPLTEQPLGAGGGAFGYSWDRTINKLTRRVAGEVALFPGGEQVVRVDSVLGFATTPTDIQMAAAELVGHWHRRSGSTGRAAGYRGADPGTTEVAVGNYLVPHAVMELLTPWARKPGIF